MSWLADLAGKAESLLEKVDKTAANALQAEKGVGSEPPSNVRPHTRDAPSAVVANSYGGKTDHTVGGKGIPKTNININDRPSSPKPKSTSQVPRSSSQTNIGQKKNDDQLFEFLNSGPSVDDKKKIANQLRSSSPVQTSSPKMPKLNNAAQSEQNKKSNVTGSGYFSEKETSYQSDDSVDVIDTSTNHSTDIVATSLPEVESVQTSGASQSTGNVQQPARVSNLELENKLLRKEVNSLNEELLSLAQRSKEAQERLQSSVKETDKLNQQLQKEGTFLREFQSREDDLREALGAKDSQLAVLRIRIQESDQELRETKQRLGRFQNENERILRDHTDSSGIQNQVLDDLRARLQEAELTLKHEQEAHQQTRTEAAERQSKLESEQRAMVETVTTQQKSIVGERRNASECTSKLRLFENKLLSANQEMRDYKEKAGRILQAKEKVIASLKEGKSIVGDSSGITSAEYEAVCQEKDVLRDELHQAKYTIEQLKVDVQDLEQQLQSESEIAQEQSEHLQSSLEEERKLKEEANHDVLKTREELQIICDDHYRQKTTLITQIQEREGEIEKLKNQLLAKSYTTTSEAELEKRVRALTENLIQKQTVIEALGTEKSSLVLQLERLEMQYKDIQRSTSRVSAPTSIHGFDDSDEAGRVRSITSIMPSQITESAKVHKAVNQIDKFSIRLGVFLRRYPIARLMLIVYVILLHLWVFVVLLTYQPEVHTSSPAGPMPNIPKPD